MYQVVAGVPQEIATHSAGPVWQLSDGSGVFSKVLKSQPAPNSIPLLLLATQAFGTAGGALAHVTYVLRTDTKAAPHC